MALRVYISYSNREDQVLALRLQTLASTRPGLNVYVPPASTRTHGLAESDVNELAQANLLILVISGQIPPIQAEETQAAAARSIPFLPIVLQGAPAVMELPQHQRVFYVDPRNPYQAEREIENYLSQTEVGRQNTEAIGALILLALGLMILAER
jgi:hypothetical protein